jgi:hypothetical protein
MPDPASTIDPTTQTISLTLAGTPPNITKVDGWAQRREAAPWREKIAELLAATGPAVCSEHVDARIVVTFPDHRERNPELYEVLIRRALGEALTEGGWIEDRRLLSVTFGMASGSTAETTIALEVQS